MKTANPFSLLISKEWEINRYYGRNKFPPLEINRYVVNYIQPPEFFIYVSSGLMFTFMPTWGHGGDGTGYSIYPIKMSKRI